MAGEKGCKCDVGVAIRNETRGLTRVIPSLSIVVKVNKNGRLNLRRVIQCLIALVKSSKSPCLPQASSWAIKQLSKRFHVTFTYSVETALKLSVEVEKLAD